MSARHHIRENWIPVTVLALFIAAWFWGGSVLYEAVGRIWGGQ